jgi:hypothetical protein
VRAVLGQAPTTAVNQVNPLKHLHEEPNGDSILCLGTLKQGRARLDHPPPNLIESPQVRFSYTLEGASDASQRGLTREWVHAYLREPAWENRRLAAIVYGQQPIWKGPIEVEIDKLYRVAGPGTKYRYPKDILQWKLEVDAIARSLRSPLDLPPIIARPQPDLTHVSDGNHRLDALAALGYKKAWALLWHDSHPGCTGNWSPFAPENPPIIQIATGPVLRQAKAFQETHSGDTYPNMTYVCAKIDDRVIGLATLMPHDACLQVHSLFVLPEYRNRLLGTSLLKHLSQLETRVTCFRVPRLEQVLTAAGFNEFDGGFELLPKSTQG